MSDDPQLEDVRDWYIAGRRTHNPFASDATLVERFDTWLTQHDAAKDTEIDRLNATIQRVREDAISWVGKAWDDGNATGLDGWVGPGRGTLPIDREAQHARTRMVHKADRALEGGEAS